MVGKEVTVGVYDEKGNVKEVYGIVEASGTYDGQPIIYLDNGEGYFLSDIMAVGTLPPKEETPDPDGGGDENTTTPPVDDKDNNGSES